jgi:protein-tyrosine phosphatase
VLQRMPHTDNEAQRRAYEKKVLCMKDYFTEHRGRTSVPDPYYGGAEGFELALDLIEDGCEGLLNRIIMQRNE